jgi:hypothetical protein
MLVGPNGWNKNGQTIIQRQEMLLKPIDLSTLKVWCEDLSFKLIIIQ